VLVGTTEGSEVVWQGVVFGAEVVRCGGRERGWRCGRVRGLAVSGVEARGGGGAGAGWKG